MKETQYSHAQNEYTEQAFDRHIELEKLGLDTAKTYGDLYKDIYVQGVQQMKRVPTIKQNYNITFKNSNMTKSNLTDDQVIDHLR